MFTRILLAGAASALMIAGAQAADFEASPPAYDWTGPYIGLQLGYGWGDLDNPVFTDGGDPFPGGDVTGDFDGVIGGVHAGWNFQHDIFVFGIEGDVNLTDLKDDIPTPDPDEFRPIDIELTGSLRARAGLAFDRILIYATGGLAVADVELGVEEDGSSDDTNETYWGYTIGGGLEYAIWDSLSARVEYRYTDLGTENYDWDTIFAAFNADYEIDYHTVQGGISWHF